MKAIASCGKVDPVFRTMRSSKKEHRMNPKSASPLLSPVLQASEGSVEIQAALARKGHPNQEFASIPSLALCLVLFRV
jgi:hypothetical protein